ncbi:uncharacterized protein LOC120670458 [Panicum virgatum]|uniref:uncharacterized protein LOC120670458 n=1 Tax=Panicum virgatum TaxID=38727 RepID=UPI0019D60B30|nr:uncharacterized protein LOC120670458 [Panicum virgatum]
MAEASTQIAADPKAAATYGDDWRSQLQRDARSRIISKIMETMGAYSRPLAVPEGLDEILKAAVQLEKRPMPQQERSQIICGRFLSKCWLWRQGRSKTRVVVASYGVSFVY